MTDEHGASSAARTLARAAAWLMVIGLLTGGYVSAAMTGQVHADPHEALAAHLNALIGACWMLGVAWTFPMLRYGVLGQARLAWTLIVANYANWAITAVKAWLHVAGIAHTGNATNDAVFGMLTLAVVLPSLGAATAWAVGFKRHSR